MPSIEAMTVTLKMKIDKIHLSKKQGIGCWRILASISGHTILDWVILHSRGETRVFRHDGEYCP